NYRVQSMTVSTIHIKANGTAIGPGTAYIAFISIIDPIPIRAEDDVVQVTADLNIPIPLLQSARFNRHVHSRDAIGQYIKEIPGNPVVVTLRIESITSDDDVEFSSRVCRTSRDTYCARPVIIPSGLGAAHGI